MDKEGVNIFKKIGISFLLLLCFLCLIKCVFSYKKEIPSGIENTSVQLHMTVDEVRELMMESHGEYSEHDECQLTYSDQNFYGYEATIMYVFDGPVTDRKSKLVEIYLWHFFSDENECSEALQTIEDSLMTSYAGDWGFGWSQTEGAIRSWDPKDLISERTIFTANRFAVIIHCSKRIIVHIQSK